MKKLLFLLLVLPLVGFGQLQIDMNATEKYEKPILYKFETPNPEAATNPIPRNRNISRDWNNGILEMSSSGNAYTLIMSESTCLTATQSTGTIAYTHRGDPGVVGTDVGDIVSTFTSDEGMNFTDLIVVENATGKNNRYPSGVLYNPTGNTDPMNQYVVVCGPSHDGATESTWDNIYYGSMKLDGTNQSVVYVANPLDGDGETYELFIRRGLTSTDDGSFHVMGPYGYYDVDPIAQDTITRRAGYVRNGTWNSTTNSVDWTTKKIDHSFFIDSSTEHLSYQYSSDYKTAWSQDGSVGYVYFLARDSANDQRSMQPIVYKSTDKGANWTLTTVQNFADVQGFKDNCRKTRQGTTRPYFMSENDAVVDADGYLHIFGLVRGASTDHEDSLDYSWIFPQQLYHVYMTNSGWEAEVIDTIWSEEVTTDNTPFVDGGDAMGWDHRIQASRTEDGEHIFCFWSDALATINEFPDLFGWGRDLDQGTVYEKTDFTGSTDIGGAAYFPFVSDITLKQTYNGGVGLYTPVCIQELSDGPIDPVYHMLLKFTGWNLNSIEEPETISLTDIYPNPAKDQINISLDMKSSTNVNVEIINLIGQSVMQKEYKNIPAGQSTLQLNMNDIDAGIYIVKINDGVSNISGKVIVE